MTETKQLNIYGEEVALMPIVGIKVDGEGNKKYVRYRAADELEDDPAIR